MGDIFIRDLTDLGRRHIAFGFRPFGIELRHMVEQKLERGPGLDTVMFPHLAVGPIFYTGDDIGSFQRGIADFFVPRLDRAVQQVADQRLPGRRVAHVVPVRTDQIG